MAEQNNAGSRSKRILTDLIPLVIGELAVALLVGLGFGLADVLDYYSFDYRVISGALLGVVVIVANYLFLSFAVDREIRRFAQKRGTREMDDEEAAKFAKENAASMQNAIQKSFIIRMVSIVLTLVIAFILDWFNPLATAIPMFALRPLLTVIELIRARSNPKPDPNKFIRYDDEDENKNEEESDQ